ncbi:probable folate-biopterin transporter 7 isoform X2 [Zingiber officinale]|uniref:probable folate-biopterin transporter 7 isoform X2 n=1 Tax=Zingiber officinale TaxID=94328 RepID=UPI001C4B349A|nr:probable folate-biopterin transporter 7 isoform X2 [Zingiber officinale]
MCSIVHLNLFVKGSRDLFLLRYRALLQVLSWIAIATLPATYLSIPILTLFLLLGNLGASIAEVANDAIVAEAGKQPHTPSESGQLQSFVHMIGSIGGGLGNLLGGLALSHVPPKTMFLFFAVLLVIQYLLTISVSESSLNLPKKISHQSKSTSIWNQISELGVALHKPEIYHSIMWFSTSYAIVPLLNGTMFFYQTQYLNLPSSVIGFSKVFGQVALLTWSIAYNKQFKKFPAKKILFALQSTVAMFMVSDVFFVKGTYRAMGIPDSVYVVIFSGLSEALLFFKILPSSVLMAAMCPAGCEASVMAFLMSAIALANIISGYFGVALAASVGVSAADNFSYFPVAILIQAFCTLLPLCLISWVPDVSRPVKKED